jgi:predicted nucleic acid-binding protein
MNQPHPFLDTNVLLYAFAAGDRRSQEAERLMAAGGVVSVQALNEFAAVAHRKLKWTWTQILDALDVIRELCLEVTPVTLAAHTRALRIAQRFGYTIHDATIIAAAIESGCRILYSEDMQHGQRIEGLLIRNPFA